MQGELCLLHRVIAHMKETLASWSILVHWLADIATVTSWTKGYGID